MKIFIAECLNNVEILDIISQKTSQYQSPISSSIFKEVHLINSSDAILVPHDAYEFAKNKDYLNYLNELSEYKTIIFSDRSDFPIKPLIKNSISLRVAINPRENSRGKIVVPYNIESLSFLNLRKYQEIPSINFTGYMPSIMSPRRFFYSLRQSPINPIIGNGALVRNIGINKCKKYLNNFTHNSRSFYFLDSKNRSNRINTRQQYLKSIEENDFIFTPRGDANQSQRFYEAMSAGRLTLIPDSQMKFPYPLYTSKFESFGIQLFNLNSKKLNKLVHDKWNFISTPKNYFDLQNFIRNFYINNLEFNSFMKKIFNFDLDKIKRMSNINFN